MKKILFSAIFAFASILGTFVSCSTNTESTSVEIPVGQIFRSLEQNRLLNKDEATTSQNFELFLNLSGDVSEETVISFEKYNENQKFYKIYTFKNIPIGSEITANAELKQGNISFYKGTSETLKVRNAKNELNIQMKRINSDSSIGIKQLPQEIFLETSEPSFSPDDNTISLDKTTTATFHVCYLEGEGNDSKKDLPDWVTYSWKINGNPLEIDGTIAKFDKTKGNLSIDITKNMYLVLGENQLIVEISCENNLETVFGSVNFTITE